MVLEPGAPGTRRGAEGGLDVHAATMPAGAAALNYLWGNAAGADVGMSRWLNRGRCRSRRAIGSFAFGTEPFTGTPVRPCEACSLPRRSCCRPHEALAPAGASP